MPTSSKNNTKKVLKPMSRNKKGRAGSFDEKLGMKIRQRRALMGMTQENLAETVGVTFQQIQKYENGTNRVSATRLFEFSQILKTPVNFFFDSLDDTDQKVSGFAEKEQEPFLSETDILKEKETLELIRVYYSIKNPKLRKDLFNFVKSMADTLKTKDK
jgi:transcriptional regulator with XRE-family HTH domain